MCDPNDEMLIKIKDNDWVDKLEASSAVLIEIGPFGRHVRDNDFVTVYSKELPSRSVLDGVTAVVVVVTDQPLRNDQSQVA